MWDEEVTRQSKHTDFVSLKSKTKHAAEEEIVTLLEQRDEGETEIEKNTAHKAVFIKNKHTTNMLDAH